MRNAGHSVFGDDVLPHQTRSSSLMYAIGEQACDIAVSLQAPSFDPSGTISRLAARSEETFMPDVSDSWFQQEFDEFITHLGPGGQANESIY